jgi:hypothetical protein
VGLVLASKLLHNYAMKTIQLKAISAALQAGKVVAEEVIAKSKRKKDHRLEPRSKRRIPTCRGSSLQYERLSGDSWRPIDPSIW